MSELKGMNVSIGADVTGLKKGTADARKELASVAVAAQKADSSLGSMGRGTNQATNAMMNFGRVVQDAPFGIIGITNNINPLLESFQRLKAETGSTGGAIQALGSSLIGAGGLGFAISIVTSLLTVFAMNSRSAGKETEVHKEKVDETKKAADEYASAIGRASSAVVSHQGKLAELNTVLRSTSSNIQNLSQNILNQALAQYLAGEKEGLLEKYIAAKTKEALAINKVNNPLRDVKPFTMDDFLATKNKNPLRANPLVKEMNDAGKAADETKEKIRILNETVRSLGLDSLFADMFKMDEIKVSVKKVKIKPEKAEWSLSDEFLMREYEKLKQPSGLKATTITPKIVIKPSVFFESANFTEAMTKAAKFATGIAQTVFTEAFTSIGDTIGNAIAGGGNFFGNLFGGIFKALGSGIRQLGVYAIATSKLILALKATLGTSLGVAGGIALVALGTLISAAANKIQAPKFATGVRDFIGGTALVGERGPELVQLPRGSNVLTNGQTNAMQGNNMGGHVIFEIDGMKLRGVLQKTNQYAGRNGFN